MPAVSIAIVPVAVILTVGYLAKRLILPDPRSWAALDWFSYFVFTPAILTTSIASADLSSVNLGLVALAVCVPYVVVTGLALAVGLAAGSDKRRLTSVIQGSTRFNTYVGLTIASIAYGNDGVATFAILSAILAPLVNLIAVTSLAVLVPSAGGFSAVSLLKQIAANPLILGCALGMVLSATHADLPVMVSESVRLLASPGLVAGTLVAGAGLVLRIERSAAAYVTAACLLKLVVLPLASALTAVALHVDGSTIVLIALISSLPVGPATYILARRMGGDAELMASIAGVETIASVLTLPLLLGLTAHLI